MMTFFLLIFSFFTPRSDALWGWFENKTNELAERVWKYESKCKVEHSYSSKDICNECVHERFVKDHLTDLDLADLQEWIWISEAVANQKEKMNLQLKFLQDWDQALKTNQLSVIQKTNFDLTVAAVQSLGKLRKQLRELDAKNRAVQTTVTREDVEAYRQQREVLVTQMGLVEAAVPLVTEPTLNFWVNQVRDDRDLAASIDFFKKDVIKASERVQRKIKNRIENYSKILQSEQQLRDHKVKKDVKGKLGKKLEDIDYDWHKKYLGAQIEESRKNNELLRELLLTQSPEENAPFEHLKDARCRLEQRVALDQRMDNYRILAITGVLTGGGFAFSALGLAESLGFLAQVGVAVTETALVSLDVAAAKEKHQDCQALSLAQGLVEGKTSEEIIKARYDLFLKQKECEHQLNLTLLQTFAGAGTLLATYKAPVKQVVNSVFPGGVEEEIVEETVKISNKSSQKVTKIVSSKNAKFKPESTSPGQAPVSSGRQKRLERMSAYESRIKEQPPARQDIPKTKQVEISETSPRKLDRAPAIVRSQNKIEVADKVLKNMATLRKASAKERKALSVFDDWIKLVNQKGLDWVRKNKKNFRDHGILQKGKTWRSVSLDRDWRVFYEVDDKGVIHILDINNHDYRF